MPLDSKLEEAAEKYSDVEFDGINGVTLERKYSSHSLYSLEHCRIKILAFQAGAEFERNRILELLRSKTAMGWELDHAFRSGDLSIVSDWLESQLSDKSD